MKFGKLIAIACIVVSQEKLDGQYLTTCRPTIDEVSQVILPGIVRVGKQVTYKPIKLGNEAVYGQVLELGNALVSTPDVIVSTDGKVPN